MEKDSVPSPAHIVQRQRLGLIPWLWAHVQLLWAFVARHFRSSRPELKQLEGQVSQPEIQEETDNTDVFETIEKAHIKMEKHFAEMAALLQEDMEVMEALRRLIKNWEEDIEEREMMQQLRKKEAETPETVRPEVVEEQMMRDLLARRRGWTYWPQMLCVLLVSLELFFSFVLGCMVLYASYFDPELFYRLLLSSLPEETYRQLAYALGNVLPVRAEGLLPF